MLISSCDNGDIVLRIGETLGRLGKYISRIDAYVIRVLRVCGMRAIRRHEMLSLNVRVGLREVGWCWGGVGWGGVEGYYSGAVCYLFCEH
jgi:hypothetical protein